MSKSRGEILLDIRILRDKLKQCAVISDGLAGNKEINNLGLFMHVNMLNDTIDWGRGYVKLLEKAIVKKVRDEDIDAHGKSMRQI